jgi:hypothetical protein
MKNHWILAVLALCLGYAVMSAATRKPLESPAEPIVQIEPEPVAVVEPVPEPPPEPVKQLVKAPAFCIDCAPAAKKKPAKVYRPQRRAILPWRR